MTIMDQMLNACSGPFVEQLDYEQWAMTPYDDASPSSLITGQDSSTLPSFEAAEAALLMFQNGGDGMYEEQPESDEYEWNGCEESGVGNYRNDNPFQHNGYDWNGWNVNMPEITEEYSQDASSPVVAPYGGQASDTFDAG